MKRLVAATGNDGKVRELRQLLRGAPVELVSLRDASLAGRAPVAFPEEGGDYRANALAKARAVAAQWGIAAIADDSGLEVDALDGAPGPYSARYGGAGLSDAERVARLLDALRDVPPPRRGARFVCVAALAVPGAGGAVDATSADGVCAGAIATRASGGGGFGYDPVFVPAGVEPVASHATAGARTMAEVGDAVKDRISHRARAVAALVQTRTWESWLST
ncbi:MAG: non-canonical purine NTP pyrophosphatase [Myxococcota bacterium]